MIIVLAKSIFFPRKVIYIVHKKNIKVRKKLKFWISYRSLAMYLLTGLRVPFDGSNVT